MVICRLGNNIIQKWYIFFSYQENDINNNNSKNRPPALSRDKMLPVLNYLVQVVLGGSLNTLLEQEV